MSQYHNVIIFGAGASADAGIPMLDSFVNKMWEYATRGKVGDDIISESDKEILTKANNIRMDAGKVTSESSLLAFITPELPFFDIFKPKFPCFLGFSAFDKTLFVSDKGFSLVPKDFGGLPLGFFLFDLGLLLKGKDFSMRDLGLLFNKKGFSKPDLTNGERDLGLLLNEKGFSFIPLGL